MNGGQDNVDVVNRHYLRGNELARKERLAIREGGQFLMQTSKKEAAAALSALPDNQSSDDKGTPSFSIGN